MRHLYTFDDPVRERDIAAACRALEDDELIAYQTEANWAIGCLSTSSKAIERVRLLKGKKEGKQLFSLVCRDISMASEYASIDSSKFRMLKSLWPSPVTVILPSHKRLPKLLNDKRKTVGIQVPRTPIPVAMSEHLGMPILTTTLPLKNDSEAYLYGHEVAEVFGHAVSVLLDLGHAVPGVERSIIDLCSDEPVVVREGLGYTGLHV